MKTIHIQTWDRKDIFEFYKNLDHPMYTMTFTLDVTTFYQFIHQENQSFYFGFMWVVMDTLNRIDAFKYRFINDEVVSFDTIHPSFTDQIKETERFKIVTVNHEDSMKAFIQKAKKTSLLQGQIFINMTEEVRTDLVYISTFPWASFTQVTFAHNHDKHDAIPRITWGKFEDYNSQKLMSVGISVHHAFVDGIHVGQFINQLQAALNQF